MILSHSAFLELKEHAKRDDAVGRWAKEQLTKHQEECAATSNQEPKEKPIINTPGKLGNCFDCAKPLNGYRDYRVFATDTDSKSFKVCKQCADVRYRKMHQP